MANDLANKSVSLSEISIRHVVHHFGAVQFFQKFMPRIGIELGTDPSQAKRLAGPQVEKAQRIPPSSCVARPPAGYCTFSAQWLGPVQL